MPPFKDEYEGQLTWTCHICKRKRPDKFISTFVTGVSPVTMDPNIRYCNDNSVCVSAAQTYSYLITPQSGAESDDISWVWWCRWRTWWVPQRSCERRPSLWGADFYSQRILKYWAYLSYWQHNKVVLLSILMPYLPQKLRSQQYTIVTRGSLSSSGVKGS